MTKQQNWRKTSGGVGIWKRHYYARHLFYRHRIGYTLLALFLVWMVGVAVVFFWSAEDIRHIADSIHIFRIKYDEGIKQEVDRMTAGYPIANMSVYIAQFDRETAAYLVSIAKKESNWGKHVPVKDGKDCYNYWGFRDPDNTEGSDGHTCFRSKEQAVRQVGRRIHELVREYGRETPQEMVVWKCGSACSLQDAPAQKWVSDVEYYYQKFMNDEG